MATERPAPSPGVKTVFLIRRREAATRDQLVAHWFAHHMPAVVARQEASAARGEPHARRYVVTLFDPAPDGARGWDGMAALWWDRAPPARAEPHGTAPTDTFQQMAEPYVPWLTTEHVIVDPASRLPVEPLTLNAPFPCTRSGFLKVSFLVTARPGTDFDAFFAHWLDVHVPNVRETALAAGGFGYVVNHSLDPARARYAGLAELYFPDEAGWSRFRSLIRPDGMERWVDEEAMPVALGRTEMIGVP